MMFVRGRLVDVDLGDLDLWCRAHLSAGVDEVLFRDGYLSTVLVTPNSRSERRFDGVDERSGAEVEEGCRSAVAGEGRLPQFLLHPWAEQAGAASKA